MAQNAPVDINSYLSAFPDDVRQKLERIRALAHEAVPQATETISYGIPTIDVDGEHLVSFAGWKKHIAMYPIPVGAQDLPERLVRYSTGKGTARFPLDEPLPEDVVLWIVDRQLRRLKAGELGS